MKNKYLYLLIVSGIIILFTGCAAKNEVDMMDDLGAHFEKGMTWFEKGKYEKARSEFDFIVMNNPGSQMAVEAQYYLAESLFQMEKFIEASVAFEQYIRYSNNLEKIEKSRYRICECAIETSMSYQKDQASTMKALDLLQEFIEDFPMSEFVDDAYSKINEIRNKLARKKYETARLYLKLEEYDSALIYFNQVLENYYDTPMSDDARIGIIFTYILKGARDSAESYLRLNRNNFHSDEKLSEAEELLENTRSGKLTLREYIKLYR